MNLSFSSEVKLYLCEIKERKSCCRRALLYGLLFTQEVEGDSIVFFTPLEEVAILCADLILEESAAQAVVVSAAGFETHISGIFDAKALKMKVPLPPRDGNSGIDMDLLPCENCAKLFFRGLFIACGSVTSPKKGYHLELLNSSDMSSIIKSFGKEYGFSFRRVVRGMEQSLYIKDSTAIEDFLAFIGAAKASFEFMNAKISRDVRNDINRLTNCETANIDKAATASAAQLEAIRYLSEQGYLEKLSPELYETAKLRMENPELSLNELKELFETPISKSGLYHRLRKIVESAKRL